MVVQFLTYSGGGNDDGKSAVLLHLQSITRTVDTAMASINIRASTAAATTAPISGASSLEGTASELLRTEGVVDNNKCYVPFMHSQSSSVMNMETDGTRMLIWLLPGVAVMENTSSGSSIPSSTISRPTHWMGDPAVKVTMLGVRMGL